MASTTTKLPNIAYSGGRVLSYANIEVIGILWFATFTTHSKGSYCNFKGTVHCVQSSLNPISLFTKRFKCNIISVKSHNT